MMKRILDIIAVVAAAPLWLPAVAVAALAVAIADGRPVFFRQQRAGRGGRPFMLLKFRTMRDGPGSDMERTTRLGRFLRRTSIDELPQLLQVLSGKMSLVGPRPLPVKYLPRYTPEEARRHEVRPGLTGWAQVNGRNAITWERKLELDVWYVDNRTVALDLTILWMTVRLAFAGKGVNASADDTMGEFRPEASRPT